MKSIIHIVGNRPQFVKLAVLHQELAQSGLFSQKIVHTGQHFSYEMSELFFKELNIPPADINFDINNLSTAGFIGAAADRLEQYFINAGHCIVFVYGDTNTTVAAAMADGPAAGLAVLETVDERLSGHYRLDAVRAHLLEMSGDATGALVHYRAAAGRTTSLPEQRYLAARAARLKPEQPASDGDRHP